jgi:hypothetical protein
VGTGTGTLLGGFSVDVGVDMGMIVGDEDGSDVGNREGVADGRGVGVMYSFLSSPWSICFSFLFCILKFTIKSFGEQPKPFSIRSIY